MKRSSILILLFFLGTAVACSAQQEVQSWIRINQLGYLPEGTKVAVFCSKENVALKDFELLDAATGSVVFKSSAGNAFGAYGPFIQSYRFNFSSFKKAGRYYLQAGSIRSAEFNIGVKVYDGAADFCLRYMRQQRSGFNPFLKDSCHTHDGYVLYGSKAGIPDSAHIDVVGGWHDASDYLQYSSTSANATWHLLAAYRDFPNVFGDEKQANGLDGKNGLADVLDEAKWGLDWLLKMHPKKNWMFNQIADDRDHINMRLPAQDSQYGRGYERPVYFITGEPQQRGKFMNDTKGTSSTAAKFAGSFSLGAGVFYKTDSLYAKKLIDHAYSAIEYALIRPGVTQTVSVRSPYIYAEDNWTDDMELGFASLSDASRYFPPDKKVKSLLDSSFKYAGVEKITPWLYRDTANHYQYYPFINLGHYELAKQLKGTQKKAVINYYKQGIEDVWNRAKLNAFYRGVPFIWCSNNLTTSFAIQCLWYRQLSGDNSFAELEQANIDWLFGCNPWGTGMVYGLPSWGDTPADPHSAFSHTGKYPVDGGLVDGPVYTSIFKNLIGIQLYSGDEYSQFQSGLAVYHDDYGDYSTNEPTMDGTASLIYLLAAKESESKKNWLKPNQIISHGAIIRGDTTAKEIALVFTGDEFGDGGNYIAKILMQQKVHGSFFLTGNFYRNPGFKKIISRLKQGGNYMGSHSDKHLLYCDWDNRDSLLVSRQVFENDLQNAYKELSRHGIKKDQAHYFLPPYEWYNDSIAIWAKEMGLQLVNFTPGTRSNADYTFPAMGSRYVGSDSILNSILQYEKRSANGLNGFILLIHIGTDPQRTDKFYNHLQALITTLKTRGYRFVRIDELL